MFSGSLSQKVLERLCGHFVELLDDTGIGGGVPEQQNQSGGLVLFRDEECGGQNETAFLPTLETDEGSNTLPPIDLFLTQHLEAFDARVELSHNFRGVGHLIRNGQVGHEKSCLLLQFFSAG